MGSTVPPSESPELVVDIIGTSELASLDIIRVGAPIERIEFGNRSQTHLETPLAPARHGDVIYLRLLQRDGGAAWSSPFFVDRSIR